MENKETNEQLNQNAREHPILDDYEESNGNFTEETAAEITNDEVHIEDHDKSDTDINSIYGWVALGLSVISFFLIPLLFAAAGIILGFIARGRDATILGNTAIATGVLSILARLFILPLI